MTSVIKNVTIVNSAHVNIHLETREDIEAFKEMLNLADHKLRDRYVGGGDSPAKKLIVSLQDALKAQGI